MEPVIVVRVEENRLMHWITVRAFCLDVHVERIAIGIAITMLDFASKVDVVPIASYVPEPTLTQNAFSEVSFTVMYKNDEAREKFLKFIKK